MRFERNIMRFDFHMRGRDRPGFDPENIRQCGPFGHRGGQGRGFAREFGRHGGGRRRMFDADSLRLILLKLLSEQADAVAAAMERLAALATDAKRTNGAPIRRAMENLRMALGERLQREGVDEEAMLSVAAIIDEASQKIERLK